MLFNKDNHFQANKKENPSWFYVFSFNTNLIKAKLLRTKLFMFIFYQTEAWLAVRAGY